MNNIQVRCWIFVALVLPWLLWGCAGPSANSQNERLINKIQSTDKITQLQEKMAQLGTATLGNYKDYIIGPEDLLEISCFGQDDLYRELRVNGEGEITVPLVGSVKVGGLTPPAVEKRLVSLYKEGYIKNPQINVFVKEYQHQRVVVTGAVATPGSYELIGPRTLLEVLGKAGGLKENSGDTVHIIRSQKTPERTKTMDVAQVQSLSPGAETIIIDLQRLLKDGDLKLNFLIKGGDVIHVPPAKMAFVFGAVKKPGQVPVKERLTVTQALALTEGLDPLLASDSVNVVRLDEHGERIIIPVSISGVVSGKDPDPELKANDVVFVSEALYKRFLYNLKNMIPGSVGIGASLL